MQETERTRTTLPDQAGATMYDGRRNTGGQANRRPRSSQAAHRLRRGLGAAALCMVVAFLAAAPAAGQAPVDGPWRPVVEQDGLAIDYIVYRKADNANNGVVLRLANRNAHAVRYRFVAVFRTARDARERLVEGRLEAGQQATGDLDGLFFIPFPDGQALTHIGLRGLRITPEE